MDLLRAIAVWFVIEGLAIAIFASSIPAVMALLDEIGPDRLRRLGLGLVGAGCVLYLLLSGGDAG